MKNYFAAALVLILSLKSFSFDDFTELHSPTKENTTQYLIESAGRIDELIAEIKSKENLNRFDKVSFSISTLSNLSPMTLAIFSHLMAESRLKLLVFLNEYKKNSKTLVSETMTDFIGHFMITSTVYRTTLDAKNSHFLIHRDDLGIFKNALNEVRKIQKEIIFSSLKKEYHTNDPNLLEPTIEHKIVRNRASYLNIYNKCSKDVASYKHDMFVETFKNSVADLYYLSALTPKVIKLQIDSKLMSPSLKKYLSQDVLEIALTDCFNNSKSTENYNDFIQRLLTIESLSHGFVFSGIGTAIFTGKSILNLPAMQPIISFFKTISPILAKRIIVMATIVAGIFCSYELKVSYDETFDKHKAHFTSEQYKNEIASAYIIDINNNIKNLKISLNKTTLRSEIEKIETDIHNWQQVADKLSQKIQDDSL